MGVVDVHECDVRVVEQVVQFAELQVAFDLAALQRALEVDLNDLLEVVDDVVLVQDRALVEHDQRQLIQSRGVYLIEPALPEDVHDLGLSGAFTLFFHDVVLIDVMVVEHLHQFELDHLDRYFKPLNGQFDPFFLQVHLRQVAGDDSLVPQLVEVHERLRVVDQLVPVGHLLIQRQVREVDLSFVVPQHEEQVLLVDEEPGQLLLLLPRFQPINDLLRVVYQVQHDPRNQHVEGK